MHTVFLDTCIILDCFDPKHKHESVAKHLGHLQNLGHELYVSYTVLGELVEQCMSNRKDFKIHDVANLLLDLNPTILHPTKELRGWCVKTDEANLDNYGASDTDRTHLAYAITAGIDYFVTHQTEVRNLRVPVGDAVTRVVDLEWLLKNIRKN